MQQSILPAPIFHHLTQDKGYIIHEEIGEGLHARVYRIHLNPHNPTNYALKISTGSPNSRESIERLEYQCELLNHFNHPGIAKVKEYGISSYYGYCVIEYAENGNLTLFYQKYLAKTQDKLSSLVVDEQVRKETIKYILAQIISTLSYLHHCEGVIHRDIKLENVVLDSNFNVKIIDFGIADLSDAVQHSHPAETWKMFRKLSQGANSDKLRGSKNYLCPQIIAPKKQTVPITHKVDIWAFGVIAYRVMCGTFPTQTQTGETLNTFRLFCRIRDEQPPYPQFLSGPEKQLLSSCLHKDYRERLSISEVMKLAYFTGVKFEIPGTQMNYNKIGVFRTKNPILRVLKPSLFEDKLLWYSPEACHVRTECNHNSLQGLSEKWKKLSIQIRQTIEGQIWMQYKTDKSQTTNKLFRLNETSIQKYEIQQASTTQVLRVYIGPQLHSDSPTQILIKIGSSQIFDSLLDTWKSLPF